MDFSNTTGAFGQVLDLEPEMKVRAVFKVTLENLQNFLDNESASEHDLMIFVGELEKLSTLLENEILVEESNMEEVLKIVNQFRANFLNIFPNPSEVSEYVRDLVANKIERNRYDRLD